MVRNTPLTKVKKAAGDSYEYFDLEGATVTPGFIESHSHLINLGGVQAYPDITPATTPTIRGALEELNNSWGYHPLVSSGQAGSKFPSVFFQPREPMGSRIAFCHF